jgi:hypothetical protein
VGSWVRWELGCGGAKVGRSFCVELGWGWDGTEAKLKGTCFCARRSAPRLTGQPAPRSPHTHEKLAGPTQLGTAPLRFFLRLRLPGTTATFSGPFHFVVLLRRTGLELGAALVVLASHISIPFAVYLRKDIDKQKAPIDTAKREFGRRSEGHSFLPV